MTAPAGPPADPTTHGTGALQPMANPSRVVAVAVCRVGDTAPRTMRRFVAHTARHLGVDADATADLALICTELVTNVCLHSGSPDVTVTLRSGADRLVLGVDDHGTWRAPVRSGDPQGALGGRGLDLVLALATTLIEHTPGGTRVRCRLPRPAAAATTRPDPGPAHDGGATTGPDHVGHEKKRETR
jgi:anti-sigma regulatory factor (Ser/Thr protein kinase)